MSLSPRLLMADSSGRFRDHPRLLMACSSNGVWRAPKPEELEPLPKESELFLLPGRTAAAFDPAARSFVRANGLAVAAFAAPGHALSAHPTYFQEPDAPTLPLFAYAAVGYARGKLWICARKVDSDPRQEFRGISRARIARGGAELLRRHGSNRLIRHIIENCAGRYDCPAARNFALGRYEAPLPTSRACQARCLGCISEQAQDAPFQPPQCRLEFIPSVDEIVETMRIHEGREQKAPVCSFGQGCEGDPLTNPRLLSEAISRRRAEGGRATINCNTSAADPDAAAEVCASGLTSMRVSLNSARPWLYEAYYRPKSYNFSQVRESLRRARRAGVHTSLNLLYFPGITDSPDELAALAALCREDGVEMIQWRNLNIDPLWLIGRLRQAEPRQMERAAPGMGLAGFMAALSGACPWLRHGYFNPWLGARANLSSPCPAF